MDQRQLIHEFNDQYRPRFNNKLLKRYDEDLIQAMKDVIYSCERESTFTIKILEFTVIDNYDDINHILWQYTEKMNKKNEKKKQQENESGKKSKRSKPKTKVENPYDFINLKPSAIMLLKVVYYIQITEKKNGLVDDTLTVYIAIPRVVDDFYFLLNGKTYSAMYQIVDASTYNNSAAKNSKKQSITFKTMFMPIRVYRYKLNLVNISGEAIPCIYFIGNMFKKSLLLMKYIIAKMGLVEASTFLKCEDVKLVNNINGYDAEEYYIFPVRDMYIVVPRFLYDNIQIVQSFCYTLYSVTNYMKDTDYEGMFNIDTWIKALGAEFVSKDLDTIYDKGISILQSLEFIYDIGTMKDLKLSMEDKSDIYRVLRWIMYEFNSLRQKDNLDISTKKVRWAEYIASLYASHLAGGIYRISDKADKADLSTITKAINITPMFLINAISKCPLVNYKSCVNDLDSIIALKYTYKGVSGIGEKSNAISSAYRSIHPSHLGHVDIDSSSNSDPGVSGTICPLANIYDGHFEEYEEPSTWESELNNIMDTYRSISSKVVTSEIVNNISNKPKDNSVEVECAAIARDIARIPLDFYLTEEYIPGFDMFGDGIMWYLEE